MSKNPNIKNKLQLFSNRVYFRTGIMRSQDQGYKKPAHSDEGCLFLTFKCTLILHFYLVADSTVDRVHAYKNFTFITIDHTLRIITDVEPTLLFIFFFTFIIQYVDVIQNICLILNINCISFIPINF